jgi:hypothetical protein
MIHTLLVAALSFTLVKLQVSVFDDWQSASHFRCDPLPHGDARGVHSGMPGFKKETAGQEMQCCCQLFFHCIPCPLAASRFFLSAHV